ncbi:PIR protein, putative [Plasmodium sp.]|nr:PIR protein, putative [Plasmodium sp.]
MKFNFTNILLFSLSLNILLLSSQVYNQRNHKLKLHKQTTTSRVLCECELYAPENYDNDTEMKAIMENYNRQTSVRFKGYDERMKKNRQKYKEQCDKDIQGIILKNKIEKELTEKLLTLQTDISTNDIPTCVCEKSVADKTEKFCHNCGYGLGSVAPSIGLLGVPGMYGWKAAALVAATNDAITKGLAAGEAARIKAGINAIISALNSEFGINQFGGASLKFVFEETNYTKVPFIRSIVYTQYQRSCVPVTRDPICSYVTRNILSGNGGSWQEVIKKSVETTVSEVKITAGIRAEAVTQDVTAKLTAQNAGTVNVTYASSQIAIIASVVAILVIVLVMIIIYLILRYRRKMKMKKKLQYIKLLKE